MNIGTSESSKFKAKLEYKKFLSILFAIFRTLKKYSLTKSAAPAYRACIQFGRKDYPSSDGIILSEIDSILPYYIDDYEIQTDINMILQKWFTSLHLLNPNKKTRVEKAAHFINNAMISDATDAFIYYFISLDAPSVRGGVWKNP